LKTILKVVRFWFKCKIGIRQIRLKVEKEGIKLEATPGWERTDDIQGHRPKFKIHCFNCYMHSILNGGEPQYIPMGLRHSVIILADAKAFDNEGIDMNQMSYKCPRCAWFISFRVLDDKKYIRKLWRKDREGFLKFIPDCDDWSEEDELIKIQLAALGYWGGREDCEKAKKKLEAKGGDTSHIKPHEKEK